nr:protein PHYLLO, chloroplastic [Tanacetum cinerariifolium]
VAVSPGSRALNWFCSQNPSLEVFPQFFVSTGVENPTNKLLTFNRTRGIYGIGAALYIRSPCSSDSVEHIPISRYRSVDSTHPIAYGLFGHTSVKFENNSLDIFIPQIELVEYDGLSILTATLAWDGSSLCVYEEAFDDII